MISFIITLLTACFILWLVVGGLALVAGCFIKKEDPTDGPPDMGAFLALERRLEQERNAPAATMQDDKNAYRASVALRSWELGGGSGCYSYPDKAESERQAAERLAAIEEQKNHPAYVASKARRIAFAKALNDLEAAQKRCRTKEMNALIAADKKE